MTVSIGICEVAPDSFLTNREVEHAANGAKNYAKKNGKNCIAASLSTTTTNDFDLV